MGCSEAIHDRHLARKDWALDSFFLHRLGHVAPCDWKKPDIDIDQDRYVCSGLNGGSDAESMIEAIVDLSMSDELQGARAQVVIAELEALSKLTDKDRMGNKFDHVRSLSADNQDYYILEFSLLPAFLGLLVELIVFVKALKEAIEVFCNKGVSGSSSDELLVTFCDNILKIGFGEKMCRWSSLGNKLGRLTIALHSDHLPLVTEARGERFIFLTFGALPGLFAGSPSSLHYRLCLLLLLLHRQKQAKDNIIASYGHEKTMVLIISLAKEVWARLIIHFNKGSDCTHPSYTARDQLWTLAQETPRIIKITFF
ncbi:hypothetical protein QYE76_047233 [Lolium multiflorum]|uniref:Uncharacterized protein n=1 Tax=Lolium multiflorum TaxID=4521 RepID=A0AAD8WZE4_LOLMU|nr:hypothetical protein QYE76_047233 [Lolium multiflorum]